MNKFIGIGRLTKDPEIRRTQSGKSVASFSIAIDDGYGDKKSTDFLDIVAWEGLADSCGKYLGKGSKVCVVGKVKKRSYEKDGRKIWITEILAQEVEFLDTKKEAQSSGYGAPASGASTYGGYSRPNDYAMIDDDDAQLPF